MSIEMLRVAGEDKHVYSQKLSDDYYEDWAQSDEDWLTGADSEF